MIKVVVIIELITQNVIRLNLCHHPDKTQRECLNIFPSDESWYRESKITYYISIYRSDNADVDTRKYDIDLHPSWKPVDPDMTCALVSVSPMLLNKTDRSICKSDVESSKSFESSWKTRSLIQVYLNYKMNVVSWRCVLSPGIKDVKLLVKEK